MRFDGFTEGDQLSRGNVDVVVTDGFSGNIALKTAEGTARFVTDLLRRAFNSSLRSKAGFALVAARAQPAQGPPRPQQSQWRGLPWPERPGREEPRRRQCRRASPMPSASPRAWCATTSPGKIGDDLDNFRAHAFANESGAMTPRSVVLGTGSALPKRRVDNAELCETGRHHRRNGSSSGPESAAAISPVKARPPRRSPTEAARNALDHAGVDADRNRPHRPCHRDSRPDLPVVGDQGPGDARHPRLHRLRRARRLHRLPLCADASPIRCCAPATARKALVIGAETFSRILDWEDRATCVLFGDGAGALVLERRGGRARHPRDQAPCRRPAQ